MEFSSEVNILKMSLVSKKELSNQTQESPKEASEFVEFVMKSSIDGILSFDSDLKLCFRNQASFDLLKLTAKDLPLGSSIKSLRKISDIFEKISDSIFQIKTQKVESVTIAVSKGYILRCYPLKESWQGKEYYFALIIKDQKFIENQKKEIKAEKINALTHFTQNIAHEINNPLATINNSLYLLRTYKMPAKKHASLLNMISENINRIANLIDNLRKYSYQEAVSENCIDVSVAIQDIVGKAFCTIPHKDINLEYKLPDYKVEVFGDLGEFRQMLYNIVVNAIQAMPEGGKLTSIVDTFLDGEKRMARIRIIDTGYGMASEEIEYAFNPMYTQKRVWNSIGLGLSVSHRIASYMHGDIEITSKKDEGTAVTITIPAL